MTQCNAPAYFDFSRYIGIPYREPDADSDVRGLNCWQLCEKILIEAFGIHPPHYDYRVPCKGGVLSPIFINSLSNWKSIAQPDVQPGDVVLLRVAGYPMHIGIMIDKKRMIHTLRNIGSMMDSLDSLVWKKRIEGFYRWSETA